MSQKKQIKWLNCAKCFAILAVIIDHTRGVLYTNPKIGVAAYFSVSLFILIAGMTSYMSNLRHNGSKNIFLRSSKKIIISYCFATFIYLVYYTHTFNVTQYINYLVHFNIIGAMYYVLLYLQLMLVNGFLFDFLQFCSGKKYCYLYEFLAFAVIIVISIFTTNYTNLLGVYGGGGKLLGGTFLILYYIGMIIAKYKWLENTSVRKSIAMLLVSFPLLLLWWGYIFFYGMTIDQYFPWGIGKNPPGISLMILAVLILFSTFGFFTLIERYNCTKWIVNSVNWIGKNTLNIFMYHFLIMNILSNHFNITDIWIKRFVYIIFMIYASILIGKIIDNILHQISLLFKNR